MAPVTFLQVSPSALFEWVVPDLAPGRLPERAQARLRKFVLLAVIISVTAVISIGVQVLLGAWRSATLTSIALVDSVLALRLLRLRVPLSLVATGFLSIGVALAAVMGLQSGRDGLSSFFWMAAAPLVSLAVAGRRAGYATLVATLVVAALSLYGLEHHWLANALEPERSLATRATSFLAAVMAIFFIVRAYELESERSIAELQQRNQALAAARAEADRANRAKSDFLATISHEIRTPLNGITGMVSLLDGEKDPRRVAEGLRIMQQSADTLLAVISDVLDFSKIESNHLELEQVPVSPKRELQVVVDLLQTRAAEQQTDVELTLAADVPQWIRSDPTRFRQVAMNLVANAVKFTRGGRVTCDVSVKAQQLRLDVVDTGIGMSAEVVNRLFSPFAQADASTTRRFGGTGLGLVITHRLVEAMGGRISVQSRPGHGSHFTVELPIVPSSAPSPAEPMPAPPVLFEPRRVLLVEDNAVNQLVAKRLLERLGHHVVVAGDGVAALEVLAQERFDVVLMDCHMPRMDGFDATRALRAKGCATPVYALTAAVSTEDRERCLEAGMNDVLSKPLRQDRLELVLSTLPSSRAAA